MMMVSLSLPLSLTSYQTPKDTVNQRDLIRHLEIVVSNGNAKSGNVRISSSRGDGSFDAPVDIDVKDGCPIQGIRWGDVNNDGFDDFICITPTGEMFVSLNTAAVGQTVPTFRSLGLVC